MTHKKNTFKSESMIRTFFYWAAVGNINELTKMINTGININIKNVAEETAIMQSCMGGKTKAVDFLLKSGANPHIADDNKSSCLHKTMVFVPEIECIDLLLAAGANINAVDDNGDSPLFSAVARSIGNVVQFSEAALHLIKHGANPDQANKNGVTPIDVILRNPHHTRFSEDLIQYAVSHRDHAAISSHMPLNGVFSPKSKL